MKRIEVLALLLIAVAAWAANELDTSDALTYTKNGSTYQINLTQRGTVTGTYAQDLIADVGTNDTQFSFGAVTTPGFIVLYNTMTNTDRYVEAGGIASNYFVRINAGEHAKFRLSGTNMFWKATGSNCVVRVLAIPN